MIICPLIRPAPLAHIINVLLQPLMVAVSFYPHTRATHGHHIKGKLGLSLAVHSLSSEPLVLTHFFVLHSSLPLIISVSALTSCSLFLASPCLTLYS